MDDDFRIETYSFNSTTLNTLAKEDEKESNWPIVYNIYNKNYLYVGETTNLKARMGQHFVNSEKLKLRDGLVKVIFDDTFNKSAALDLESYLIQYFSADGKFKIMNKNDGMCDRDYYNKELYRKKFEKIWEKLRELKIADKTIEEINNSELFKFSPYKNLNAEQLEVVTEVLQNIDESIASGTKSLSIIGGDAGTGKTIVIMYLAKLLADLQTFDNQNDDIDDESNFSIFFEKEQINKRFKNKKIALVIPQQSLRGRIESIFKKIDFNDADIKIFSPLQFGLCKDCFDITLVDEAHLLKIGLSYAFANGKVNEVNKKLFGSNDGVYTELDWIMKKSKNVVMVYSNEQRIRPVNIDNGDLVKYTLDFNLRHYTLKNQMRSRGGKKFIQYIDEVFTINSSKPSHREFFDSDVFEVKLYNNIRDLISKIRELQGDAKDGNLARLVAGYAWKYNIKNPTEYGIDIDGVHLNWNSTLNNWIGSDKSLNEVGSIYTVQGDDLNYVGVIIGEELIYRNGKIIFNKDGYADKNAMKRNNRQTRDKVILNDEYFRKQVLKTYKILMSRAVKGMYLYVCDDELREYLSNYFDVVK